jgi:hypothetical protein
MDVSNDRRDYYDCHSSGRQKLVAFVATDMLT